MQEGVVQELGSRTSYGKEIGVHVEVQVLQGRRRPRALAVVLLHEQDTEVIVEPCTGELPAERRLEDTEHPNLLQGQWGRPESVL